MQQEVAGMSSRKQVNQPSAIFDPNFAAPWPFTSPSINSAPLHLLSKQEKVLLYNGCVNELKKPVYENITTAELAAKHDWLVRRRDEVYTVLMTRQTPKKPVGNPSTKKKERNGDRKGVATGAASEDVKGKGKASAA